VREQIEAEADEYGRCDFSHNGPHRKKDYCVNWQPLYRKVPPKCGAEWVRPDGSLICIYDEDIGGLTFTTCNLPKGHDGDHVPFMPGMSWREA
jgi:hypothetical protein